MPNDPVPGVTPAAGATVPEATKTTATPAPAGPPGATPAKPALPSEAPSVADRKKAMLKQSSQQDWRQPPKPDPAPKPETGPETADPASGLPAGESEDGTPTEDVLSHPGDKAKTEDLTDAELDALETGDEGQPKTPKPKWENERVAAARQQRDKAKAREAKEREARQALEAEVIVLRAKAGGKAADAPAKADDLDGVTDVTVLRERHEQAAHLVDEVEALLDDTHDRPEQVLAALRAAGVLKDGEADWEPAAMRDYLRKVRADAQQTLKAAPKRAQFLHQESAAIDEVLKAEPELAKADSAVHQAFQAVRDEPSFAEFRRRDSRWPGVALRLALGELALRQRREAAAPTAPAAPAKPRLPAVPALPKAGQRAPGAPPADAAEAEVVKRGMSPGASEAERLAAKRRMLAGG